MHLDKDLYPHNHDQDRNHFDQPQKSTHSPYLHPQAHATTGMLSVPTSYFGLSCISYKN